MAERERERRRKGKREKWPKNLGRKKKDGNK